MVRTTGEEKFAVLTKFALQSYQMFAIIALLKICGVGISVLRGLPKPVSGRNENLVFATVLHHKRVRETKLSRYLLGYKILYLQG